MKEQPMNAKDFFDKSDAGSRAHGGMIPASFLKASDPGVNPPYLNGKWVVIFTRFTSNNQREESHEAQEKKVRQHLDFLKIGHINALVLSESATRGDLEG